MIKSKRLSITGSIQTVFFKQFVKENADSNNIKGYVRALENGKIEIFMEGDGVVMQKLLDLLSKSSRYAQVREFEIKDEKFQDFKDFKILKF